MTSSQGLSPIRRERGIDSVGMVASTLCTVHCLVVAVGPGLLGAAGLGLLLREGAEWVFSLSAVGLAIAALAVGWQRHRSWKAGALLLAGVLALLAARATEHAPHDAHGHEQKASAVAARHADEHDDGLGGEWLSLAAGVLLVSGHLENRRALSCCEDA